MERNRPRDKGSANYIKDILSYALQIFKIFDFLFPSKNIWHTQTPVWHNLNLLSGGLPFVQPTWLWLNNINGEKSILDFHDLIERFNISFNTLFLYFQLRSALKS